MHAIGVDTGGTFTDLVRIADDGTIRPLKVPSTPAAPHRAILDGLAQLRPPPREPMIHGTTVATNTVLERKGARVALVTTRGFRDVLEIGRGDRDRLYDLTAPRVEPLVPRARRLEAAERVRADGSVAERLSATEMRRILAAVRRSGAEAVAVCLLHAYANPEPEQRLAAALADLQLPLSVSHRLVAEFREFERTSTTVLNAYVQPRMARYLHALLESLGERPLRVMQSGGGTAHAASAADEPVRTLLSGPVGGVVGALHIARATGHENIITFDMGGTSTDVSLALGEPARTRSGRVAGFPVQTSMIDIHTIGAGGGSIAAPDAGGALAVGPQSAGADPGPVAYGRGGTRPTVTDANVLLGRLPLGVSLAGDIQLDHAAAKTAVAELARRLELTPRRAAEGIVRVVVSHMARAVRTITLDRGRDPRDFTLVAFGGAAGLHAAELAESLGVTRVLVPAHAGVLSAYGLIAARAMKEVSRTVLVQGDAALPRRLAAGFAPLERDAVTALRDEGHRRRDVLVERLVDCRYQGQSHDLSVRFDRDYVARFHAAHLQAYGFEADRPVVAVNLRVRALGPDPAPPLPAPREALPTGFEVIGPEAIPCATSTAWVPRGWRARVDEHGGLDLTPA